MFLKKSGGVKVDSEDHDNFWFTLVDKSCKFKSNDLVNPIKYYNQALRDELKAPKMRYYKDRIVFEKELPRVYSYYFKDWQFSI